MKYLFRFVLLLLLCPWLNAGGYLKQNIGTTVNLGPFTKISDGTAHTGATVTGISVSLMKHSDTQSSTVTTFSCTADNGTHGCIETIKGYYNVKLAVDDVDTLGRLEVVASLSGDFNVPDSFMVTPAANWACLVDGDCAQADDVLDRQKSGNWVPGSIGEALNNNVDEKVSLVPTNTWSFTIAEPTGPLTTNPAAQDIFGWLKVATHNKLTVTNTTKTLFNSAGTAIATQAVSDNGTTYQVDKAQ